MSSVQIIILLLLCTAAFLGYLQLRSPGSASPARNAVIAFLVICAIAAAVLNDPGETAVEEWLGVANSSRLVGHILILAGLTALHVMLLYWRHSPQEARRMATWRWVSTACTVTAMAIAFLSTPTAPEPSQSAWQAANSHRPAIAVYIVVFNSAGLLLFADAMRETWSHARSRELRTASRVGMILLAAGCAASVAYWIGNLAQLVAQLAGGELPQQVHYWWNVAAGLVGTIGLTLGIAVPAAAALIAAFARRRRIACLCRDLRPLYEAILTATPPLRDQPRRLLPVLAPIAAKATCWFSREDRSLVERMVVIREGYLQLRPWMSEQVQSTAVEAGKRAGLRGRTLDATAEAAVIAVALRARATGQPAYEAQADTPVDTADLTDELQWLAKVSKTMATSRIVADVARVVETSWTPPPSWPQQVARDIGLGEPDRT